MYIQKKHVQYSRVDCKKRLSPVSVLNYFEDIAIDNSSLSYSVDDMERDHLAWLVISSRFCAERYPRHGEEISVATWPHSFSRSFAERGYEIYDKDGDTIIRGCSLWVLYDTERMRTARITEDIAARYTLESHDILPIIRRDIDFPADAETVLEYTAQMRDIDSNNHVNNVKYLEFAAGMIPDGAEVAEFEIFYRHAARLGDALVLKSAERDGRTLCEVSHKDGDKCATMRFLFRQRQ